MCRLTYYTKSMYFLWCQYCRLSFEKKRNKTYFLQNKVTPKNATPVCTDCSFFFLPQREIKSFSFHMSKREESSTKCPFFFLFLFKFQARSIVTGACKANIATVITASASTDMDPLDTENVIKVPEKMYLPWSRGPHTEPIQPKKRTKTLM